jgi:HEAT repeat protein
MHTVDASTPEAIVAAITRPGMTDEQKALAVWRYCWEHLYHWPAPQEEGRSKHELDVVYDAVKLFNVYGYTYCFAARAPAEALCQAAGLEARSAGIGGHLIWEACFGGRYHYIDSDQRGFSRLPDGAIAALEDYRGRARELVLAPKGPSTPFFPSVRLPRMIYEQKQIFTGYMLNHAVHYYQHDKFRTTHSMNLALRPGERFTRSWANLGKWNCPPGLAGECKAVGYVDPWPGPRDPYAELYPESPRNDDGSPLSYANGLLVYRPNLSRGAGDYAAGVFADENLDASGPGFGPAAAARPARADFRVHLPYVIAGWPGDIEKLSVSGAAVVSGRCLRRTEADQVRILVSSDEGASWQEVWSAAGTGEADFAVDISRQVEGRYGYLVRFELRAAAEPGDARVLALGLDTACQLSAAALPAVRAGKNRMTVSFEPGAEVFEESIQFDPKVDPARRAFEIKDLVLKERSYTELGPKEKGGTGHIVYELAAPAGRRVAWAKVGGAFRSDGDVPADETYRIWYAVDEPRDWKLLWEADPAPYLSHWCFEANEAVPIRRAAGRVFVKYELGRSAHKNAEGGKMVAARLVWGCDPAGGGAPKGGVKVTHAWKQDGETRSLSRTVRKSGASYSFEAPGGKVENLSMAMELDGRGPAAEGPHPLMVTPPEVRRHALDDNENVKAMREALARLDQSPTVETAADVMWNSKSELTRGVMPPALMTIGGDKAREELKKAVGKLDSARGCLMELLSFEGPVADLAGFLKDKKASIRADAARLLARKGEPAAVEPLRAALAAERDAEALAAEAAALVRLAGADCREQARKNMRNNRMARYWLLDLTWGLDAEKVLERCEEAGKVEIGAALAAIGEDFTDLDSALRSPEKKLRWQAALALGESGRPEAEKGLLVALGDKSRWVRLAATVGLAKCGGKASLKPLERAAEKDADAAVRSESRWAAGELKKRLANARKKRP